MNVLITGAEGQLGRTFFKKMHSAHDLHALSRKELDVTNADITDKVIRKLAPDWVIHAAAYTAVDACEKEPKKAFDVNALGTFNVAHSCKKHQAKMIYISSDYVFDGEKGTAYTETDHPNPKSIYGLSKWLGEKIVRRTAPESYVVRTSWLFGHGGKNFVNTMRTFAKRKQEVRVVSDQIGSPTYADDLAEKCIELLGKPYGIYHISNQGSCSWDEFAAAIYEELGSDPTLVKPITTEAYGALAPRPVFSVLHMERLKHSGISIPRSWGAALKEFMAKEASESD
jgi:dTDP-4-dehydrorhamnose reductase